MKFPTAREKFDTCIANLIRDQITKKNVDLVAGVVDFTPTGRDYCAVLQDDSGKIRALVEGKVRLSIGSTIVLKNSSYISKYECLVITSKNLSIVYLSDEKPIYIVKHEEINSETKLDAEAADSAFSNQVTDTVSIEPLRPYIDTGIPSAPTEDKQNALGHTKIMENIQCDPFPPTSIVEEFGIEESVIETYTQLNEDDVNDLLKDVDEAWFNEDIY